jgi:hypothetical protein
MKQLQERGWVLDPGERKSPHIREGGDSVCHYGTSP